tara:strand:- start:4236 stop:5534 length:1299 start_codon:yes stop_codon:yes gene_type:complete
MEDIKLEQFNNIHFIGIGGIGISAIARMLLLLGKNVSGSDSGRSPVTEKLEREGAAVYEGHDARNLKDDTDLVVYTIAIAKDNPELLEAQKRGVTLLTYPEALGLLTSAKKTIAVAGTHGKTTTTAMIAEVLMGQNMDPTVVVGSFLNNQKENFIGGASNLMVVEACEYCDSFLNLHPFIGVITNIDSDHLDYFGSLENIQKSFRKFAERIPNDGYLVCNPNDENVKPILEGLSSTIIDYSEMGEDIELSVPGKHNIKNAQAALSASMLVGVTQEKGKANIKTFKGTWRRQEFKGETKKGALIYDDYAHHPQEVAAVIEAFKSLYPDKKVSLVFQPHLYSRTKLLFDDFVKELSNADGVMLAPIYAAREKKDDTISSKMIEEEINKKEHKAIYVETPDEMVEKLKEWSDDDDVVITVGAGDIYKVGERLLEN